ncbi:hypothetical protein PAXINDRAFT_156816 [Paxillus involutus ATCC 200175]|uniref:Uncharacterized protein n=1 Tax=Paxillus involutus ATCC 200175 TaxID=664439 RepID=A0A0C9TQF2_PAXIN|nr:hypothetical protein PAXINDRAFT_156816 [Paxillus involutus ATCC 200175]
MYRTHGNRETSQPHMYQQLLEKVNNLGAASNSSTTSDPIVTIHLQPDANPPVNPSSIDDPEKLFFCESQWKASRNRNRGVLGANNKPTFPFLVDYKGNHATAKTIRSNQPVSAPMPNTISNNLKGKADRKKYQGIKISNPLARLIGYTSGSKENTTPCETANTMSATVSESGPSTITLDNISEASNQHCSIIPLAKPLATCVILNGPTTLQVLAQSLTTPISQAANPSWMPITLVKPKLTKMIVDTPTSSLAGVSGGTAKPERKCTLPNPNTPMHFMKKPSRRNLCAHAYREEFDADGHTITCSEFKTYCEGLMKEVRRDWEEKGELIKAVNRMQAANVDEAPQASEEEE